MKLFAQMFCLSVITLEYLLTFQKVKKKSFCYYFFNLKLFMDIYQVL